MSAKSDPRTAGEREGESTVSRFYYRRSLNGRDLIPAAGVAVAAGLVAFYLARIFLARTPIDAPRPDGGRPARTPRAHGG